MPANIPDRNTLMGHSVYGQSWEGFYLESIMARCQRTVQGSFFRTIRGAEIDLVLEQGGSRIAVEFKVSSAARPSRGCWTALEDLNIERAWIIAPVQKSFPLRGARVSPLPDFLDTPDNSDFFL